MCYNEYRLRKFGGFMKTNKQKYLAVGTVGVSALAGFLSSATPALASKGETISDDFQSRSPQFIRGMASGKIDVRGDVDWRSYKETRNGSRTFYFWATKGPINVDVYKGTQRVGTRSIAKGGKASVTVSTRNGDKLFIRMSGPVGSYW